jgi:Tol biopolymer transport system component
MLLFTGRQVARVAALGISCFLVSAGGLCGKALPGRDKSPARAHKLPLTWRNAPLAIEGLTVFSSGGHVMGAARDGEYMGDEPAWAPDHTRLAYATRNYFYSDTEGTDEPPGIWVASADLTQRQQLTAGQDSFPAWSPDGSRVVFARQVSSGEETEKTRLCIVEVKSRKVTSLTAGAYTDTQPVWSFDGKTIAFCSTRSGKKKIWLMDARRGSVPYMLREQPGGDCQFPAWIPQTKRVSFVSSVASEAIYTVAPEQGQRQRIPLRGLMWELRYAWSPDGQRIAFARGITRHMLAVFCANKHGRNEEQVFPIQGGGKRGEFLAW